MRNIKNHLFRSFIFLFTFLTILILLILISFLWKESSLFFSKVDFSNFIFGRNWSENFGVFNILLASFYTAILSCVISFPVAMGISVFIVLYANNFLKNILSYTVNILAGIPSVIYGFFGLFVVVKFLEKNLKMSAGESVLAGAIILSVMILPYFVSNLVESVEISKNNFKRDSDSLGVSKEFFIRKIVLKDSFLVVLTGFILSFSRAVGETMAVMMVIGNAPIFPKIFSKAQTVASLIALEIGMSEVGSLHYSALFACGFVLLVFVLILNILLFILNIRKREKYDKI